MTYIHFTGTAHSPTLQLKRGPPTMLVTYAPNDTVTLTGTEGQIKRLMTLALDSVQVNITLLRPTTYTTQQELDDLRAVYKELFAS